MINTLNYHDIWLRWQTISLLDKDQSKDLLNHLHNEVKAGCELIGKTAIEQVQNTPRNEPNQKQFITHALTSAVSSVYGGYFLFLLTHNINPEKQDLAGQSVTEGVGDAWTRSVEANKISEFAKNVDPIIKLMLDKIIEIRLEQLISLLPEIIHWSYKYITLVQQQLTWCVYQGYLLGQLENDLATKQL